MDKHWNRLWASVLGEYQPSHKLWPDGRESGYKGYFGELTHSLTNVWVESLRLAGIYDRHNKEGRGVFPWLSW